MCVCVCRLCVCVSELCVCVYWSMRHQFACIRNSFPLVIESLDKLSTAVGTSCLPSLTPSLSSPAPGPDPSTACPVMQINERVVRLPLPPVSNPFWPGLVEHQLAELICILCGSIYSKCIIQTAIYVACTACPPHLVHILFRLILLLIRLK